jgi:hypothetical protein
MVESSLTMLISLNYRHIEGKNTASSYNFSSHTGSLPHDATQISLEPVRANRQSSEDQKIDFATPIPGSFGNSADQFA